MALVNCAECGEKIAESADVCPKCGATRTRRWKASDKIAAAVAVLGLIGFAVGLYQYNSGENWKRREFVAKQIKDFHDDKLNEAFLLMLDYNHVPIDFHPYQKDSKDVGNKYKVVTFDDLVMGIKNPKPDTISFDVRQTFEHFLQSLSRFNYYTSYDAIDPKELCQEFEYPIAVMTARKDIRESKLKDQVNLDELTAALEDYFSHWPNAYVKNFIDKISNSCPNPMLCGKNNQCG